MRKETIENFIIRPVKFVKKNPIKALAVFALGEGSSSIVVGSVNLAAGSIGVGIFGIAAGCLTVGVGTGVILEKSIFTPKNKNTVTKVGPSKQ